MSYLQTCKCFYEKKKYHCGIDFCWVTLNTVRAMHTYVKYNYKQKCMIKDLFVSDFTSNERFQNFETI